MTRAAAQSANCQSCDDIQQQFYNAVCTADATSGCALVAIADAAAAELLAGVTICDGSSAACLMQLTGDFRILLQQLSPDVECTNAFDTDGDGLVDSWETEAFGDLQQDGSGDPDGDGLDNAGEQAANTSPTDSDSDDDGIPDGLEVTNGLNPLDPADAAADPDKDGYPNFHELVLFGTEHYDAGSTVNDEWIFIDRLPGTPPAWTAASTYPGLSYDPQFGGTSAKIPDYTRPVDGSLIAVPVVLQPGHLSIQLDESQLLVPGRLYEVDYWFDTEVVSGVLGTYQNYESTFVATSESVLEHLSNAVSAGPGWLRSQPEPTVTWLNDGLTGGTVPTFTTPEELAILDAIHLESIRDTTTGRGVPAAGATITSDEDTIAADQSFASDEIQSLSVHPYATDVDMEISVVGGALLAGHGSAANPHGQRAPRFIGPPLPGQKYELKVTVPTVHHNRVADVKRIVVVSISDAGSVTFEDATAIEAPPDTGWKSFYDALVGTTPVYVRQGDGIAAIVEFPDQAAAATGYTFTLVPGTSRGGAQITAAVNSIVPKSIPGANPSDTRPFTDIPLVTGGTGGPNDFEVDVSNDRAKFYYDFVPGHTSGPAQLLVWAIGASETTTCGSVDILFNGESISDERSGAVTTVVVGRQVALSTRMDPQPSDPIAFQWTVPGVVVKEYSVGAMSTGGSVTRLTAADLTAEGIDFYWIKSENAIVEVQCLIPGSQTVVARARFRILAPSYHASANMTTLQPAVGFRMIQGRDGMWFGDLLHPGISWNSTIDTAQNMAGEFAFLQLIDWRIRGTQIDGDCSQISPFGEFVLDRPFGNPPQYFDIETVGDNERFRCAAVSGRPGPVR